MKVLKSFFRHSETFVGIATAFSFLLIFFCVWMTAYDGVNERIDSLSIGFVNDDNQVGADIQGNLMKQIPFTVKSYPSIESAEEDMNERKLDMVIHIPADFSEQIQNSGEAKIQYLINQASATMAKQTMEGATEKFTRAINEWIYSYKQEVILKNTQQFTSILPTQEIIQNVSKYMSQAILTLNMNSVESSIQKTNSTEGFASTMVPMMMVLASFVGAMIMSMNLNIVEMKLRNIHDKWSVFGARQIINLGASIVLSIVTLLLMVIFNININTPILHAWIFQTLVCFAFLSITQMFVVLLGPAGMLFNIISLSVQLVTSGVIVPKVMLSDFFQAMSTFFPATYAANGYYTIIFGGSNITNDMILLIIISVFTLLIATFKIAFQKKIVYGLNQTTVM